MRRNTEPWRGSLDIEVDPPVGVGPWHGPVAGRRPARSRPARPRRPAQRRRRLPLLARRGDVADLDTRRHPFHVAIENWQHDLNIGSIVRTANAFLAARCTSSAAAGGTGAVRWSPTATSTSSTTPTSPRSPRGPQSVACRWWDRQPAGREPLETVAVPRACVLVFGQEGPGLSGRPRGVRADPVDRAVRVDPVDQRLAAAAVAMHAWVPSTPTCHRLAPGLTPAPSAALWRQHAGDAP